MWGNIEYLCVPSLPGNQVPDILNEGFCVLQSVTVNVSNCNHVLFPRGSAHISFAACSKTSYFTLRQISGKCFSNTVAASCRNTG